jgi:flavin reductase (DIM6/NTAB) family NADH-FMN oxidoreductase RutF
VHLELSRRFAAPHGKRFEHGRWHPGHHGCPVLAGALAVFECARRDAQRHGDHVLIIGEVLHHSAHSGPPLLFHASRYRRKHRSRAFGRRCSLIWRRRPRQPPRKRRLA